MTQRPTGSSLARMEDDSGSQNTQIMGLGLIIMAGAALLTLVLLIKMGDKNYSDEAAYSGVERMQTVMLGLVAFGVGAVTTAIGALRS